MTSIPLDELFSTHAVINDCYPKSLNTFTRAVKRKEFINLMTILLAKPRLFDIMKLRRRELKSGPLIFSLLVDERVIVMFRYNVRGENIEVTEAIRDYVEKKSVN